jgi:alkanesulfonate monooxygenase SsuD/methylene tetrahydromethanopterin reductase-like flavin-dependent oxidoreductase (luciferase family)
MGLQTGMVLRAHHFAGGVTHLQAFLAGVEAAGIDHVGVLDHVSFRSGQGFDGLINATAVAAAHPRLPVHIGVYLLPLRHPVTVARQVSSLELLAPGRLVMGIGIGGEDRQEIALCGIEPSTRGRRTDEALHVLRRLLAGEQVSFRGEFYELDDALVLPAPPAPVPLVVGGRSDAALRRAARHGDGWLGFSCSPERFAMATEIVESTAERAGRRDVEWHHGMEIWCGFGATEEVAARLLAADMETLYDIPFDRFRRYCAAGPPEAVAEFLQRYVDAGCGSLNLIACAASDDDAVAAVAEVRRLLGAPVPVSGKHR